VFSLLPPYCNKSVANESVVKLTYVILFVNALPTILLAMRLLGDFDVFLIGEKEELLIIFP
jgi:hypothetical protein